MRVIETESEQHMFIEFTTTLTHRIHLGDEGIDKIDTEVSIDAGEAGALGNTAVFTIVKGGLKQAIQSIEAQNYSVEVEHNGDDEEQADGQ